MSTRSDSHRKALKRYRVGGLIAIPFIIIVLAFIPVIYVIARDASRTHAIRTFTLTSAVPPTRTAPPTTLAPTTTPGNMTNVTTTATATTTMTDVSTTTITPAVTTTTDAATTTTTAEETTIVTTGTTTQTTTTEAPTTTPFGSCMECGEHAAATACAMEHLTCEGNTYNCPVLCYGTFLQNGPVPPTCLNGAIPEWPPFRDCLCNSGNCTGNCNANCDYTTVPTTPQPTAPATPCMECTQMAVQGPCTAEYNACVANPTSGCALLCFPYYMSNLPVFSGCTNSSQIPEWDPLATCLCPLCTNNVTCNANIC